MKTKLFIGMALFAIMTIAVIGCKNEPEPVPSELRGTWRSSTGDTYVFTANVLSYENYVQPYSEYSSGYMLFFKYTSASLEHLIGTEDDILIFLNTAKNKIVIGGGSSTYAEFVKQ